MRNCTRQALKPLALLLLLAIPPSRSYCQEWRGWEHSHSHQAHPRPHVEAPAPAIQHKSCAPFASSCSFDKPTTLGDMIVVTENGLGCVQLANGSSDCNTVSDSQGNLFQIAIVVPNNNGTPLWYALNAKGGSDTIYFAPGSNRGAIIAEYPPALWLEDANYGVYNQQSIHEGDGVSSDHGYTKPVVSNYPNDLLVVWANAEVQSTDGIATPDPGFTLEETEGHSFALSDNMTNTPWIYMGSMEWSTPNGLGIYSHWTMGIAAFRMGALYTVRNPSFEDSGVLPACWNNGPIPYWSQTGNTGLKQPAACGLSWQVPDGVTLAGLGHISQNIGPVSAGTYTMTAYFGEQSGAEVVWEMSFYQNGIQVCNNGGPIGGVNGSFVLHKLSCNVPAGQLTLAIDIPTGAAYVDDVKFTVGP